MARSVGRKFTTAGVIITPVTVTDAYGNEVLSHEVSDGATERDTVGNFQPLTSEELTNRRDVTTFNRNYFAQDPDITSHDRIRIDGTTYSVVGDPQVERIRGEFMHTHVTLLAVKG